VFLHETLDGVTDIYPRRRTGQMPRRL
jgi:hypothetical protein